jgi:hypothetical protein
MASPLGSDVTVGSGVAMGVTLGCALVGVGDAGRGWASAAGLGLASVPACSSAPAAAENRRPRCRSCSSVTLERTVLSADASQARYSMVRARHVALGRGSSSQPLEHICCSSVRSRTCVAKGRGRYRAGNSPNPQSVEGETKGLGLVTQHGPASIDVNRTTAPYIKVPLYIYVAKSASWGHQHLLAAADRCGLTTGLALDVGDG